MRVECLIPFAGDDPHRLAAWEYVRERLPFPYRVGSCEGEWCKARALPEPNADVVVIHDADVLCDLAEAVEAVEQGAPWAIPHRAVHRISETGTAAVLEGEGWEEQTLDQRPYLGLEGGGIVVLRREVFLDCPLDPRFVGWGQEDQSFGFALRTLYGAPWRPLGHSPLVHLWHPYPQRLSRARGSTEGWRLRRRYRTAFGNPTAMRLLIEEIHDRDPDHERLHADPALG